MSDSVLSKLVSNDTKNVKAQEAESKLLQTIVDNQNKMLGVEQKRLRATERAAQKDKRKKGDSLLSGLLGSKSEQKKDKKNMFERIGDMFKGLFSGGGLLKLLGGLGIGTAIYKYLTDPKFRQFMNDKVLIPLKNAFIDGLFGKGGIFGPESRENMLQWMKDNPLKTLGLAIAGITAIIGPGSALMLAFKAVGLAVTAFGGAVVAAKAALVAAAAVGTVKAVRTGAENLDKSRGGVGQTKDCDKFIMTDISALRAKQAAFERQSGNFDGPGERREQAVERLQKFDAVTLAMKATKKANDDIYKLKEQNKESQEVIDRGMSTPAMVKLRQKRMKEREQKIEKLEHDKAYDKKKTKE